MYIIPEATLVAVSTKEADNLSMRNDVCIMLAQQGIAQIILQEDFVDYSFQ